MNFRFAGALWKRGLSIALIAAASSAAGEDLNQTLNQALSQDYGRDLSLDFGPDVSNPLAFAAAPLEQLTFGASLLTGIQGGHANSMVIGSAAFPLLSRANAQVDFGVGSYRRDYLSWATSGRVFWRTGNGGTVGFYTDYANVDPEHVGRIAVETTVQYDRITIEALAGVRSGTNVHDAFFDEVDITYYVSDGLKASVGHRLTSRGHVANMGFEFAPDALSGWTVFGEAEAGEDNNHSAFAGVRYTFGGQRHASLLERDRNGPMRTRTPRALVDVTRCGPLPSKKPATFGLREMSVLCASKRELDDAGAKEAKKH